MTKVFVKLKNISIATETFGSPTNEAIILIAGAMAPAVFYPADFCKRLASSGFFVIRFDNRDIGDSTHFPSARSDDEQPPYSIYDMVADVKGVLDYYEVKTVVIVGHSLGGSIAQLFAIKHPKMVSQLFLLSNPILATSKNKYTETDPQTMDEMWQVLMSNQMFPDYERGKNEFMRAWQYLNGKFPVDEKMAEAYNKRLYETEIIEPAYNHTKIQLNLPDIWGDLVKLPVLIHFVYGSEDYLAASWGNTEILAESLPNADFVLLDGVGHMYFDMSIWQKMLDIILEKTK